MNSIINYKTKASMGIYKCADCGKAYTLKIEGELPKCKYYHVTTHPRKHWKPVIGNPVK